MANNDSIPRTLLVAVTLCIVCALVVASAAVMLKPAQVINKALDRKANILAAAGLLVPGESVEEQFKQVTTKIVDLNTGKFTDEIALKGFDQAKVAKNSATSIALGEDDLAKIRRRENYAMVYLIEKDGHFDKVILPVRGYGLWSTLYGFLALEKDLNTVAGLGFYDHGETPGLGGEVDNPKWKAIWPGKEIYDDGDVAIELVKGNVDSSTPNADNKVDALSGATLTSRGVSNLLRFWMGELGYKSFLSNLRSGEA
ncbi:MULTISPECIES: Na(+)-translocating NADH-quinone reductase subunit C [Zhongshania]|uniref:Na(+)-translocating NADH-quinone reductase subunit C n=1 Tax=Zhongshania antarctica TaxID=641702 RepID=A0A840R4V1_9GAMM|nr:MULTISPECIES: Na(+)-translocating NADH-quinone reductase subunit C [Zhongshania]MBB5187411.1 Na+-transporting NADH:ubiquinone oxidoreductase subunit C [Zhongshania antarctica]